MSDRCFSMDGCLDDAMVPGRSAWLQFALQTFRPRAVGRRLGRGSIRDLLVSCRGVMFFFVA
jgi:hypothetical protein